jgi:hypothetical protein
MISVAPAASFSALASANSQLDGSNETLKAIAFSIPPESIHTTALPDLRPRQRRGDYGD